MNNADCYFNMTIAILNDNVYIIDRQQLTSMVQRQEVLQHYGMEWVHNTEPGRIRVTS